MIVRRLNLEVAIKKLLHQQVKILGYFYCHVVHVFSYSYFWWCGYFQGPWVSFVTTDEFSVKVIKITSRTVVS